MRRLIPGDGVTVPLFQGLAARCGEHCAGVTSELHALRGGPTMVRGVVATGVPRADTGAVAADACATCCCHPVVEGAADDTSRDCLSSTVDDCADETSGVAVLARRAAANFTAAAAEADADGNVAAGPAKACIASCTALSAASSLDFSPSNSTDCWLMEGLADTEGVHTEGVPMLVVPTFAGTTT